MPLPTSPWLNCPTPNPQARLRMFCFPYAGGAAQVYRHWSAALSPTVEVCAIELPGHGRRIADPPITQLAQLVDHLGTTLLPGLNQPFIFFGHSLGGLIAFELTRWLRSRQLPLPELLVVSAARAPHLTSTEPPLHQLPKADFLAELNRYGGTPQAVIQNDELMELLLPTLRADFALLETYRYQAQAPLSCAIAAIGGNQDAIVSLDDVRPWQIHTAAQFSLDEITGDHFFVHQPQILPLMTSKIGHLVR
ncbi:MAG: alpha/beta fold hydrolase [Cyanobacteria bacterium P01_D01_bin.6]|mgnify:CR=1 FL=1